jgi:hypothetical protein
MQTTASNKELREENMAKASSYVRMRTHVQVSIVPDGSKCRFSLQAPTFSIVSEPPSPSQCLPEALGNRASWDPNLRQPTAARPYAVGPRTPAA